MLDVQCSVFDVRVVRSPGGAFGVYGQSRLALPTASRASEVRLPAFGQRLVRRRLDFQDRLALSGALEATQQEFAVGVDAQQRAVSRAGERTVEDPLLAADLHAKAGRGVGRLNPAVLGHAESPPSDRGVEPPRIEIK